jgi:hypothetical protein
MAGVIALHERRVHDARPTATLGHFVSQAPSLQVPGEGLRAAEDREFEPRRVVTPNRIGARRPYEMPVRPRRSPAPVRIPARRTRAVRDRSVGKAIRASVTGLGGGLGGMSSRALLRR